MTNIGLIGAGMIASIHAKAATKIGTNIVAVHDSYKENAEKFGVEYFCEVLDSVASLLARDDIEGVVIAVPNDRHAELAIATLQAGKHVLLEKPMAMSLQQCDEIVQAQEASGKVLQIGFVCRYSPAALKAKQIIQSGGIGDVLHVQATLLRQRGIPGLGGWFTTKARSGGGCLIDIGVHFIDLVMHLTAKKSPTRVHGNCAQAFTIDSYAYEEMWSTPVEGGIFDVEDRVRALVTDGSGTTFQFDVSWATHLPENTVKDGLQIEGTEGSLVVDLWADTLIRGFAENGNPKTEIIPIELTDAWDDAFEAEHLAFATAIASGKLEEGAGSGEDGRLVQSIVEAIYASNELGQEVAIEQ
jgi:predicted dehydrogenase